MFFSPSNLLVKMKGLAVNNFNLSGNGTCTFPLIWGGDAANYTAGSNQDYASYCWAGAMNADKVKGKIVFCGTLGDGSGILLADGLGTIMVDSSAATDVAYNFPLPATVIKTEDGVKVLDYIKKTEYKI